MAKGVAKNDDGLMVKSYDVDNGDVELNLLEGADLEEYTRLKKLRSKKQLKAAQDIERLEELGRKENQIAEEIRAKIQTLPSKIEKKEFVDKLYKARSRQTNFVKTAYLANYGHLLSNNDFHLDIRFLDATDYANLEVDLLVGGSPCQAFSAAPRSICCQGLECFWIANHFLTSINARA